MLKLRHLFENFDLAKFALRNWEHDTQDLDKMLSYFRISSNAIYPFYCNKKTQLLRLAPIDEKLRKNIYGEVEFIEYLRKNNYPAMKPVASKNGELVLELDTQWGKYFATVFERVEGVQIEDTDYNDKIMYQYGKALGKMHKLSSQYEAKTKKWTYEEVLNWIEVELSNYCNNQYAKKELNRIRVELSKLPKTKQNYGLVHYDFDLDNVFYSKKANSCSVIDFDDGMYHWFVLDIEKCFDSLTEKISGEKLKNAKLKFIEGYKTEYELTDEAINLFPLMRRFVNLFTYTRVICSLSDTFEVEPDWLVDLREKLMNYTTEIEKSFI